ncbi:hypothetical protein B9Z19DRAFT_1128249 [Tuber borchii]|uniref:Uncharacterized protein n=1 Tax=Tuber borchii TaxID=42251 RepID=A0A2T6ZPW3_TUBBO|nr:hypothetical protein B9Z19DRAFT_1128249 [Tuber borchii]
MGHLIERMNAIEEESKVQYEITKALEKRSDGVEKELGILRPLKPKAIGIRERFFATFLKSIFQTRMGDTSVIEVGNRIAHEGDVVTDVCLLENEIITYPDTF